MFKTRNQPRSAQTRETILNESLNLFRERGLHATTMRDIAKAGDVALGAAYYYFPSKEAIIQAYYDRVQSQHSATVTAALEKSDLPVLDRLRIVFHSKLDIIRDDRRLLGALFRYTGEPDHPLSAFGSGTKQTRKVSVSVFELAIRDENLPSDIQAWLPTALWALHLGMLLFFLYDNSENQQRTRDLVDGALALVTRFIALVRLPLLKPFRGSVVKLLEQTGLVPPESGISPLVSTEPQENPS